MTSEPAILERNALPHTVKRIRRGDIDGLRAIAVLGVLAFHLGVPGIGGGYTGVDIFFVISGYLIAGILAAEIAAGTFSLAGFYERRIRRIIPAAAAMCIGVTLLAFLILTPPDLRTYGKSLFNVAIMGANFYFARKTDYFGGNAEEFPLLHTWSLAIEEQYYLVFPLLLAWLSRRGPVTVRLSLAILAAASFAAGVYLTHHWPEKAFYDTFGRVWQLLVGALLAIGIVPPLTSYAARTAAGLAGLALIAVSYFAFDGSIPFPGVAALVPVAGAALILHAGAGPGSPTVLTRLMSVPALTGIGLISYSLYLWHWPLIVLAKYRFPDVFHGESGSLAMALLLVGAASFAMAFASWRFIEQPFLRPGRTVRPRLAVTAALSVSALLIGASAVIEKEKGLWSRWPDLPMSIRSWPVEERDMTASNCQRLGPDEGWPGRACRIGQDGAGDPVLVWGDSHARALTRGIARLHGSGDRPIVTVTNPGCPPLLGIRLYNAWNFKTACDEANAAVLDSIRELKIKTVVLAGRWGLHANGTRYGRETGNDVSLSRDGPGSNAAVFERAFETTIVELRAMGVQIVVVGPVPEQFFDVTAGMTRLAIWSNYPLPELSYEAFLERQKAVLPIMQRASSQPGVTVIYPHEDMCQGGTCPFQRDGTPLYRDNNHLNDDGLKAIDRVVRRIANLAVTATRSSTDTPIK